MKVCKNCGSEIGGKDGDNYCLACDGADAKVLTAQRRRMRRRERDQCLRDLGLVRVRGALGGVYWE